MRYCLPVLLFAFVFIGYGQDSTFTLKSAIQYGLENNPESKIAAFDLELAKKKVVETTAIGLPQLNAEIGYQNFIDIPVQVAPSEAFGMPPGELVELQFGTEQNASASATASQLIFDGTYLVGLKAAKVYVRMAEQQKNLKEVNIEYEIANAYHLLVVSKENLRLTEKSLEKVTQSFNETKELYKNGFVPESSVDELELSKLNLENAVVKAKNQIKTAELLLKLQMGLDVKQHIAVSQTVEDLMGDEFTVQSFSPNQNAQYAIIETKAELQELDLKSKQAKRLPSIGAYYNYQQNAFRNEFNFFDGDESWYPTNVVGLSLKMPIFQSGMLQSQINQSRIELQKVAEEKRHLVNALNLQYQEGLNKLINARKSLELVQKKLTLGESILDKAYQNHKEGLISSFELNEKESRFLQLKGEYLQAVMSVLTAKIELEKLSSNILSQK